MLGREPHGTAIRGLEQPRRDQLAVQRGERLALERRRAAVEHQPPRLSTRARCRRRACRALVRARARVRVGARVRVKAKVRGKARARARARVRLRVRVRVS